jgi:hypothetical protein
MRDEVYASTVPVLLLRLANTPYVSAGGVADVLVIV